jgi:integrase
MLTDAKARKVRPDEKPLPVGGVTGLYFRAGSKVGTGKFTLRFVSPETGKRRDMGLGTYPAISLAAARIAAIEAQNLIAQRVDPIEQRRLEQRTDYQSSTTPTFEEAAVRVFESIAPGFRNPKHRAQWINTLRTYAIPFFGDKPVDVLTTSDFALCLDAIWLEKPETASRVRQRCDRVMTWCVANQFAPTNPVSSVTALLPKQKSKHDIVVHFPAVPWRDLPDISTRIFSTAAVSVGRQALLFLILTAARSGEVRGAKWDEIDFNEKTWVIPSARMKAGRQHRVPICTQTIDLLRDRERHHLGGDLIFSTRANVELSDMTLTKVLRDHRIPSDVPGRVATAHGFRSSFRDWASENGYMRDLAERALAHTVKNATEAAYHRPDQLEQRRGMMQEWADWVTSP